MKGRCRCVRIAGAGACIALMFLGAIQQRLYPLISERLWAPVARAFPGLAFGYLMFDTVPDTLPYYRITSGSKVVAASVIDDNDSWTYEDARFQMNAMFQPSYVAEVCLFSGKQFIATRLMRNLRTGQDTWLDDAYCQGGRLNPVAPPVGPP